MPIGTILMPPLGASVAVSGPRQAACTGSHHL